MPLVYDFPLLNSKEPHWTQHTFTQSKGLYPRVVLKGCNKFEILKGWCQRVMPRGCVKWLPYNMQKKFLCVLCLTVVLKVLLKNSREKIKGKGYVWRVEPNKLKKELWLGIVSKGVERSWWRSVSKGRSKGLGGTVSVY